MSSKSKYSSRELSNALDTFYGFTLDEDQKAFKDAIWNPDKLIVIANAKAGTGKTTIAVGVANLLVRYGYYNKINYIVSPTQEQKQGYLPGDQESKSAPYMEPLYEALIECREVPEQVICTADTNLDRQKTGEAYVYCDAHTYMRGRNFDNSVVIIDEAQNFYIDELLKVLTRIKDTCKVIMIGHTGQCDLYKHPENSGFKYYMDYFKDSNDSRVEICNLTHNYRGWISSYSDGIKDWIENKRVREY